LIGRLHLVVRVEEVVRVDLRLQPPKAGVAVLAEERPAASRLLREVEVHPAGVPPCERPLEEGHVTLDSIRDLGTHRDAHGEHEVRRVQRQRRRRDGRERVDVRLERPKRRDELGALGLVADVDRLDDHDRAAAEGFRNVGERRDVEQAADRGDLVRHRLRPLPPSRQDLVRTLDRPDQPTGVDLGDRIQAEVDRRGAASVASIQSTPASTRARRDSASISTRRIRSVLSRIVSSSQPSGPALWPVPWGATR